MDYRTFHLRLVPNSADFIQLHPGYGFEEATEGGAGHRTTLGGRLHSFRPGGQALRYTLPLDHVNSATRAAVDSYWRAGNLVTLTMNLSADDATSVRVAITNDTAPLARRMPGQNGLFGGNLFLREVEPAGKSGGGPFILGDAVWGKLDQTYNPLL